MQFYVGNLVRYKHDNSKVGIIVKINNARKDRLMVLWQMMSDGKRQWYVEPEWIELVKA